MMMVDVAANFIEQSTTRRSGEFCSAWLSSRRCDINFLEH